MITACASRVAPEILQATSRAQLYFPNAPRQTTPGCAASQATCAFAFAAATALARPRRRADHFHSLHCARRACASEEVGWRQFGGVEVAPIPGRGFGVIATRDFQKGDLIVEEVPILHWGPSDSPGDVEEQLKSLPPNVQETVWSLSDCSTSSGKSLVGILNTNAHSKAAGSIHCILCPGISRFNHSCRPNCQHAWDEAAGAKRMVATTAIAAGEEIFTCYIDIRKPRQQRQVELKQWGFDCACACCNERDEASDQRRSRMAELAALLGQGTTQQQIGFVQELLQLYDRENIHSFSLRADACYEAFELSLGAGDLEGARCWIKRAHLHRSLGEGPENPRTTFLHKFVQDPSNHFKWQPLGSLPANGHV